MSHSKVAQAFLRGRQAGIAEHAQAEQGKVGVLRGGSGGLSLSEDTVVGCQRRAVLRFQGLDVSEAEGEDYSKNLMFESGHANEDQWYDVLVKGWEGKILREEEIPIEWQVEFDGLKVAATGRPDLVLCDADGKPQVGLELKLASSAWTARDVISGKPKLDHLRQAATYMMKLSEQVGHEVPFELWYASRVNFAVSGPFMVGLFPKYGEKGHEYCKYVERKDRKTGQPYIEVKDVLPFIKGYSLRWTVSGRLQFAEVATDGSLGSWEDTVVTKTAIDLFYKQVLEQATIGKLGPRPKALDHTGAGKYDPCGYCPLKPTCDKYEASGYATWLEAVRSVLKLNTKPSGDLS